MNVDEDSEWERFVVPNLPKLVDCLRASLVLDHLRAKRLIAKEEYSAVRAVSTEEERARLLFEILPTKGKDSYRQFCTILQGIAGQSHIVTDILKKTEEQEAQLVAATARESRDADKVEVPTTNVGQNATNLNAGMRRGTGVIESNGREDVSDACMESPTKRCKFDDHDDFSSAFLRQRASSDDDMGALQHILNKRITDKQIEVIKSRATSKWRSLGRSLGYSDEDVHAIVSRFMHDSDREKLHQIIGKWKARHGDRATLGKMLDACDHEDVDIKADVLCHLRQQLQK